MTEDVRGGKGEKKKASVRFNWEGRKEGRRGGSAVAVTWHNEKGEKGKGDIIREGQGHKRCGALRRKQTSEEEGPREKAFFDKRKKKRFTKGKQEDYKREES